MTAAIIEARDLVKRFASFTAVDHISFRVPGGVIFGFLGPNGAGKTTTIKMLTTVLKPSAARPSSLCRRLVPLRRSPNAWREMPVQPLLGGW